MARRLCHAGTFFRNFVFVQCEFLRFSGSHFAEKEANRIPDAALIAEYDAAMESIGGMLWENALVDRSFLRGNQHPILSIEGLRPGEREHAFPDAAAFSFVRADKSAHNQIENRLAISFKAAMAKKDLPYAMRCVVVQSANLRNQCIQISQAKLGGNNNNIVEGEIEDATHPMDGFFILKNRDRFPHVPPELRNILHSISYGTSPIENVCRLALGIETYAASVAGFLPSMPLHVIQRIPKQKRHAPIDVPAIVIKVSPAPRIQYTVATAVCLPLSLAQFRFGPLFESRALELSL